jgi:hypothetical protein
MSFFPTLVDVVECRQDYDTLCFDDGCTTRSLGKARCADQTASFRYRPDQRDDCEVKALQPWCDRLRCCSKGTEVDPLSASRVMTGQFWWYSSLGLNLLPRSIVRKTAPVGCTHGTLDLGITMSRGPAMYDLIRSRPDCGCESVGGSLGSKSGTISKGSPKYAPNQKMNAKAK